MWWLLPLGLTYLAYQSSKNAANAQADAYTQAAILAAQGNQAYLDYLKEAAAKEEMLQREALRMQQEMFLNSLKAEGGLQTAALKAAEQQRLLELAAALSSAQTGLNIQLALMDMAQKEALPQNLARLSALTALPYLQALQGLPAYEIPTTLTTGDPLKLQTSLADRFLSTFSKLSDVIPSVNIPDMSDVSLTPINLTPPEIKPKEAEQPAQTTTPSTQAQFNYYKVVPATGGFGGLRKVPADQYPYNLPYYANYPIIAEPIPQQQTQQTSVSSSANKALPAVYKPEPLITPKAYDLGNEGAKPIYNFKPFQSFSDLSKVSSAVTETPLKQIQPDVSSILQQSPAFKYQQQIIEDSLKRRLAASGLLDSKQALTEFAEANQRLAAEEYNNIFNRLMSTINIGLGLPPSAVPQQFSSPLSGSYTGLMSAAPRTDLSAILNQAAGQRAQLYGNMGSSLANMLQNIGATQAQNLSSLGQAVAGGITSGIPYMLGASSIARPDPLQYLLSGLTLYKTFRDIF